MPDEEQLPPGTSTPDPNGDRACIARWPHRDEETVWAWGQPFCAACLPPQTTAN